MKRLILALVSFLSIPVYADSGEFKQAKPPEQLERKDIENFLHNLNKQSQLLQKLPSKTCESSYQHIFSQDEIRISVFYGYLDMSNGAATRDGIFS